MNVKKLLLSLIFFSLNIVIFGQQCPLEIKSASSIRIRFKVSHSSCNSYPNIITVTDSNSNVSTFSLDRCHGSNLDYDFSAGVQPTNAFNITVDFGSGVICSYVNGALQTLGLNDYDPDYSVALRFENKKTKESLVISSEKMLGGDLHVYDINGAKIYEANVINEAQHRINTVNWSKGIYIIKLKAKQDSWLKKIAF